MRTTTVNLAVLLFGMVFLCMQVALAHGRGPGGGIQTLATPGSSGGRVGSIGSSGSSFGSGGISFGGGGGRMTIGTGAGGISFGVGGRHAVTPGYGSGRTEIPSRGNRGGIQVIPGFQTVPPTHLPNPTLRPEIPDRGNRGGIHVIPEFQIVPQTRLPNPARVPQPHWTVPQSTYRPPARSILPTPSVQPNQLPTGPAPAPIATDPAPNPNGVAVRQITEAEVERAREFFQRRLLELAKVLERRLPPAEYDPERVTALMVERSVPVEIQIQIIDALRRGDYDRAKKIWITIIRHGEIPFKPSRVRVLFIRFYVMVERGRISYPIVEELIRNLPPEAQRPYACCGADDLLVQIEEVVRINRAIGGDYARPPVDFDKPGQFSKPEPNGKPYTYASADMQTGGFPGKPDTFGKPGDVKPSPPFGRPGQSTPLPSGPVQIVYHPKLPDRHVVVVNAQTVMVGTGGRGDFHIERGYVAEALGQRIGRGDPLAENRTDLVRSGVVIFNPTHAKVSFVFRNHQIALEPGFQQAFRGDGSISFDSGDGKRTVRYALKPGSYKFAVESSGWKLYGKTFKIAVSNERNLEPFNYIVQGEQAELAPDQTRTHTSRYPIFLRFDRGDGSATKQVRWGRGPDTLHVAINPADNLWDLFVSSEMKTQDPSPQPTPAFVPAF